jgi:hypothetical protein
LENPQSWNRYGYVGNDPINFNDPTGLQRQSPDSFYRQCIEGHVMTVRGCLELAEMLEPGGGGGGGGAPGLASRAENEGGGGGLANPRNKGGWNTDPFVAAKTGWQYLTSIWKDCLKFFRSDARFDENNFAGLLTDRDNGIKWYDLRDKATAERTVDSILHNNDPRTLREVVGSRYAFVLGDFARHVALGQNWFQDETQTQQVANTIHEALHIQMRLGDQELKGWLANFGFKPANYVTGDITDWVAGGCK